MEQTAISKARTFFVMKYSVAIRIWHWLTFLLLSASMVTVLFASTLFEHHHPPPNQVQGKAMQKQNAEQRFDPSTQTPEEKAAHTYADKIWDVHKIIGFGLCFLLLSRVAIDLSRNNNERLITRINKALAMQVSSHEEQQNKRHYVLVKWGYVLFYIFLLIMATTGFILAFDHADIFKNISQPAREVHGFVQYLMYAYILTHIAGVIRADITNQKGIVSAMINGGN